MGNLALDKKIEKLSSGDFFAFIKVIGSIDGSNVRKFEDEALRLLKDNIKFLVLDFSQLNYMNSTGMGMMVKVLDNFREVDGEMKLVQVPGKILELFNLLGIASVFSIYKSNLEALNSLPHCVPSDFLEIIGGSSQSSENKTRPIKRVTKPSPELRAPTVPVAKQPTTTPVPSPPPAPVPPAPAPVPPAPAPVPVPSAPQAESYEIKPDSTVPYEIKPDGNSKKPAKSRTVKPYYKQLLEKQKLDTRKIPGFQGYKLDTLLQFSARSDGLQPGLYVIAGQTDIGKTAVLNNIFLDAIASNEGVRGVYFNIEGDWEDTTNQLLALSSLLNFRQVTRKQEGEEKIKLDTAYQDLLAYSKTGRLSIQEVSQLENVDEIEKEIVENDSYELLIAINGAQNWAQKNPDFYTRLRYLANHHQIPILLTIPMAQPYKSRADLVSLGTAAQLADMVWILHPRDEKFHVQSESLLIVEFAKNKKSSYKGRIFLHFFKNQGKVKEIVEANKDAGSQTRRTPKTKAFTQNNPESNEN